MGVRPESCGLSELVKGQPADLKAADFAMVACLSAIAQAKGEATSAEKEFEVCLFAIDCAKEKG